MKQMDNPSGIAPVAATFLESSEFSPPVLAQLEGAASGKRSAFGQGSACREWNALDAYLRERQNVALYPRLNHEEALVFGFAAVAGECSGIDLLVRGECFVVKIYREHSGFDLAIAELGAEGNLGLSRAAELYNPSFGTRFSNYAAVWICHRIHGAITAQARAVRIPVWRSQRSLRGCCAQEGLTVPLGRLARDEEITEKLGMELDALRELQGDYIKVLSINASACGNAEDGQSFTQSVADEAIPHPGECLGRGDLPGAMFAGLANLDDRGIKVLALKFGLDAAKATSFRAFLRRLGVSYEWVGRIADLALVKVRRAFSGSARWALSERLERIHSASVRVGDAMKPQF